MGKAIFTCLIIASFFVHAHSADATPRALTAPATESTQKDSIQKDPTEKSVVIKAPDTAVAEPQRQAPDFRLFNDPPLMAREYGFGILGSIVSGTLGFFIGSGIETAISGEAAAHKGTLSFTGIRYDNNYGAFWGGSTGILLGSALTTYFVGETDEEEGSLFPTLLGTAAATGGALAIASWMGVNDDIDWKPFIPLLAVPSLGGTLGYNVSRWFNDHKREKQVSKTAGLHFHAPLIGFIPSHNGGQTLMVKALNLSF